MRVMRTDTLAVGLLVLAVAALKRDGGGMLVSGEPRQATQPDGSCRSVGGLKFDSTQRSMQRTNGLDVCTQYKKNTCCNATHTRALRLKIREPVVAKFNDKCQKITQEMACSPCHPYIGTGTMTSICPNICNDWFNACRREYYSYGAAGSLTPCYGNALICSPLSEIASNGAEFCGKMGYHVGSEDDSEGYECFDGSVPGQLGEEEPSEPWEIRLQRVFEEQSKDPSGVLIVALFLPLAAAYLAYRLYKQSQDSPVLDSTRRTLTIEQVRLLQQMSYAGRDPDLDGYGSDSSSNNAMLDSEDESPAKDTDTTESSEPTEIHAEDEMSSSKEKEC